MKDKLTIKAKREGYNARSAYKLIEINRKYNLIKKNSRVLDLGCWPGGWLQVAYKITKDVIGVDLKETSIEGIKTYVMDIFSDKILDLGKFDVVLSDVAPQTSGNMDLDQYKSFELSLRAFEIALKSLNKNGNFLVKIFQGTDSDSLLKKMKKNFKLAKSVKPKSSKSKSKEIYYVGIGLMKD